MRRYCCMAVLALCLTVSALVPCMVQAQQAADLEYTPEQIQSTAAGVFLERMATPEAGYQQFAAMHALGTKAKGSDAKTRWSILYIVAEAMNDKSRGVNQRFQCCYVISDCGDEQWVPCLAHILLNDPSDIMRSVAAEALGDFKNSTVAKDALRQALQQEKSERVLEVINRRLNQGDAEYTPEQTKSISAQAFLDRMKQAEPGYAKFSALHALATKAKESDVATRRTILTMVVVAMNDKSRMEFQRFQCCYVISDCGDEQWVPDLISVLFNDSSATMRGVAAEALAKFPKSAKAHDALVLASHQEKDQKVLEVLNRVLK